MSHKKPFHRNYRPVIEGPNSGYSDWGYIIDHDYSINPEHYTRAFLILQADIIKLFEFIEPSDLNETTYSFRIHELLMRTCIEIEANFKAILRENIFTLKPERDWNINTFKLINKTHHLDDYSIILPFWKGANNKRNPFNSWKTNDSLSWYQAYNKSKHDRLTNFEKANFGNLLDAFSGLCAILSSQFRHVDFQPGPDNLQASGYCYYGGGFGIGDFLIVDYPDDWREDEKYEFNWSNLKKESIKFNKINYDEI